MHGEIDFGLVNVLAIVLLVTLIATQTAIFLALTKKRTIFEKHATKPSEYNFLPEVESARVFYEPGSLKASVPNKKMPETLFPSPDIDQSS